MSEIKKVLEGLVERCCFLQCDPEWEAGWDRGRSSVKETIEAIKKTVGKELEMINNVSNEMTKY